MCVANDHLRILWPSFAEAPAITTLEANWWRGIVPVKVDELGRFETRDLRDSLAFADTPADVDYGRICESAANKRKERKIEHANNDLSVIMSTAEQCPYKVAND
jgi:hypothetical protein